MDGLRELLATRREQVRARVERNLREQLSAEEPVLRALVSALPRMLDALQAALQAQPGDTSYPEPAAGRLLPAGLGAAVPTRAYGLLREALLGLLEESGGALRFSELRVLHGWLDQALEATTVEAEHHDAVAHHAARLEAILESIPDAVYVGDAERITHANAPARELLGGDLTGISPLELGERLQCSDPQTGQRLSRDAEPFARALRGEAVTRDVMLCHPRTGRRMGTRCAAAPVRMGERIVGAVVVNTDMTDQQRRQEELHRTAEFRERFLGIVSHDLRNPLNAIALSAGVLLREELPPRARKAAGRISQSAHRMARMIGDLLDFTRGRLGGGIPILRQPVDLRLICRPVLEELRVAWPDRELRLLAEGALQGEWDGDRLAQLVGNLAKNALDYSPPDQPVTVTLRDEGAWVRLEVHNLGDPISPELLPQLFEPFRRGMRNDDGSQSTGLGLGLFIAQQISVAHGGTLEVRSTQEEGTTFTLRLPRAVPPK
ncbi:MAG: ATP-binding protein [Hyalangium sp.]|uniref:sensor histidine kinase n=1 Tax=Hyalangium sp. TaxID=2028555 RepID=UPI00389B122C